MKPSFYQENKLFKQGYSLVAGVDEAGRGAWAGPLVAAAVVADWSKIKKKKWSKRVADSKILSPAARRFIFNIATPEVNWAVGVIENKTIDQVGITLANHQAIALAVEGLKLKPEFVLVDFVASLGDHISKIPARVVIDGDAKVFSIALASIIAKVYRDYLMENYEVDYPGYGFAQHKGYGTRQHLLALTKQGPCGLHRLSYRPLQACLL